MCMLGLEHRVEHRMEHRVELLIGDGPRGMIGLVCRLRLGRGRGCGLERSLELSGIRLKPVGKPGSLRLTDDPLLIGCRCDGDDGFFFG